MGRNKKRTHLAAREDAGSPLVGSDQVVTVERLLPGGVGLAHAEGHTILISLSAPGDRLLVRVERARGRTLFASIKEVLEAGPARVEPPCPYFGRCGGCDFQQLDYRAQLDAKVEIIRDCLRRLARIDPPPEVPITPSPAEWHYRSRVRWQHDRHTNRFGYFERGSHNVCDVAECAVLSNSLQRHLSALRELSREGTLPDDVSEFEAVEGEDGVAMSPSTFPGDDGERELTVGAERYTFDAECFFQINRSLLAPLIEEALRSATGESALDLYCGVGLFTLPLARRFERVVGVESASVAAEYASRNLARAGIMNARVERAEVDSWLAKNASDLEGADFVLLDPPRAGAGAGVVESLIGMRPRRISYVSCDPATLARDLSLLLENGFSLEAVQAFDMFPQTHHVETVARLTLD